MKKCSVRASGWGKSAIQALYKHLDGTTKSQGGTPKSGLTSGERKHGQNAEVRTTLKGLLLGLLFVLSQKVFNGLFKKIVLALFLFGSKNAELFHEISPEGGIVTLSYFTHISPLADRQPYYNKNRLTNISHVASYIVNH